MPQSPSQPTGRGVEWQVSREGARVQECDKYVEQIRLEWRRLRGMPMSAEMALSRLTADSDFTPAEIAAALETPAASQLGSAPT